MSNTSTITEKIPAGTTPMTPSELNAVRFDEKHTLLTPRVLESADGPAAVKADTSAAAVKTAVEVSVKA